MTLSSSRHINGLFKMSNKDDIVLEEEFTQKRMSIENVFATDEFPAAI